MPELPEVETVRRGLAAAMIGRRIVALDARRPDLRFPLPENFAARLRGATIVSLDRRAKYLVMRLASGEAVIMHLGMSGRFTILSGGARTTPGDYIYETAGDSRHDHIALDLDDGARVIYNDPRRFGFMVMAASVDVEAHPLLRGLGPEPLGDAFSADRLAEAGRDRKINLKALLMDQRVVAGLGNIYVSEALHRAALSPNRGARSLADRRGRPTEFARRLAPAIRDVLTKAIDAGGSTLRDYRQADGASGLFQEAFAVYGRAGEPCVRAGCTGIVRKSVQAGRATYSCPRCQR